MIESKDWQRRFFRKDAREMASYARAEKKKLSMLKRMKRKRLSFVQRQLVGIGIQSAEYDKAYYERSLRHDRERIKQLG